MVSWAWGLRPAWDTDGWDSANSRKPTTSTSSAEALLSCLRFEACWVASKNLNRTQTRLRAVQALGLVCTELAL